MSYKNPLQQLLKEDEARYHWETHVLIDSGRFRANREYKAASEGITYQEALDEEFKEWLADKQATGFDNFSATPITGDD